jgi:hypothetical protein
MLKFRTLSCEQSAESLDVLALHPLACYTTKAQACQHEGRKGDPIP